MNCKLAPDADNPKIKRCTRWRCTKRPMVCDKCYPGECGSPIAGLGNAIELAINLATFYQGKRIAGLFAHAVGKKDCGCKSRQKKINEWGDKWLARFGKWREVIRRWLNELGRRIMG